jgi:hypothetical protein
MALTKVIRIEEERGDKVLRPAIHDRCIEREREREIIFLLLQLDIYFFNYLL